METHRHRELVCSASNWPVKPKRSAFWFSNYNNDPSKRSIESAELSMSKGGTHCVCRSCKQLHNEGVTFFEELTGNFVRLSFCGWLTLGMLESTLHVLRIPYTTICVSSPRVTCTRPGELCRFISRMSLGIRRRP